MLWAKPQLIEMDKLLSEYESTKVSVSTYVEEHIDIRRSRSVLFGILSNQKICVSTVHFLMRNVSCKCEDIFLYNKDDIFLLYNKGKHTFQYGEIEKKN